MPDITSICRDMSSPSNNPLCPHLSGTYFEERLTQGSKYGRNTSSRADLKSVCLGISNNASSVMLKGPRINESTTAASWAYCEICGGKKVRIM